MAFTVLINKNSGSVAQHGVEALSDKLFTALGDDLKTLELLAPEDFADALKSIEPGTDILVGGGDGTIRTAAAIFKDRKIPFGILPLGTMNLFAKDLSLELDPFKLAEMYKKFKPVQIDAANVNGELFLCNAMIGIPSEIAKQREENRSSETFIKWLGLVKSGLNKLATGHALPLSLSHHGLTEHKWIKAAIIANNEYEDAAGVGTFKKKSLSDGKLSVYTVNPEGTLESIALLSKLALGSWKDMPSLEFFDVKNLKINTYRNRVNVLLDGEIYRLRGPLSFTSEPGGLTILIPNS